MTEFALQVERKDGLWHVRVTDGQGLYVDGHGSTLVYALMRAQMFIMERADELEGAER